MKLKTILIGTIIGIILCVALVMAATFTPQGNIDMKNSFSIVNIPFINSINFTKFYNDFISGNSTTNLRIDSVNNSIADAPKNWTSLQNYPVACPDGAFLTQINDAVTCTSISISNYNNLTVIKMNVTNLTIGGHTLWENASGSLIID